MLILNKIQELLGDRGMTLELFCYKNNISYENILKELNRNNLNYDFLSVLGNAFPNIDFNELIRSKNKTINDKERLDLLFEYLKLSRNALGKKIGDKNGMRFQNIYAGKNKISFNLAKSITEIFPEINYKWLLTGRGGMLNNYKEESLLSCKLEEMEKKYEKLKNDFQSLVTEVFYLVNIFKEK